MTKHELKKFVTTILLEKLTEQPVVNGKLVKKTLNFHGVVRECVVEGTVGDANEYAVKNNLTFTNSSDSHFGGYYSDEMTSYEFEPNPEFYGEMMEATLSAREQLSRICGTNDQILTEVDTQNVETLINFILTNESFREEKTKLVFELIENKIVSKLYDKVQFKKLFEYLIKQANLINFENKSDLSESELKYANELLSAKFFENRKPKVEESTEESPTKCGKKSFKTGSAFENMQRILSGHQMFL